MTDTPPALAPDARAAPPRSTTADRAHGPAQRPPPADLDAPAAPRIRPWMARFLLVAWTLAMAVAFLLPSTVLPETGSWGFDKIEHAAVFALWTLLARTAGLSTRAVVGLGVAFAATSEAAQHLLPTLNRAGDLRDIAADATGIALGLAIAAAARRRATRARPAP